LLGKVGVEALIAKVEAADGKPKPTARAKTKTKAKAKAKAKTKAKAKAKAKPASDRPASAPTRPARRAPRRRA
jgi:hypothetical protein